MQRILKKSKAIVIVAGIAALAWGCGNMYVTTARIDLQEGRPEDAKRILLEGAETIPNNAEIFYLLGKTHADLEEWEEMNAAFAKVQEINPKFKEKDIRSTKRTIAADMYEEARVPLSEGEYQEVVDILRVAAMISPDDPTINYTLGTSYSRLDDFDSAIKYLKISLDHDTTEARFYSVFAMMNAYERSENFEGVLEVAEQFITGAEKALEAADPNAELTGVTAFLKDQKGTALRAKGTALLKLDRGEEALAALDATIAEDPENPVQHFNKAIQLYQMERFEEAGAEFTIVVELAPEDAEALKLAASAYLAAEKHQKVIDVLENRLFPGGNIAEDNFKKEMVSDNAVISFLYQAYDALEMTEKAQKLAPILVKALKQ